MNKEYGYTKQAESNHQGSRHTLAILLSKLRSSLEAAWSKARVRLEYAYSMLMTTFLRPFSSKRAELERRLASDEITARPSRDYGSSLTRLRLVVSMLLLLTLGSGNVWGQTDYSGTYFIANGNGYSSTNAANNFYLVPATNANYATDQPHLTTSKTGQVLNCCWQIVKNGDYYRIIHVADGKYLTANPAMDGTSGNDVGRLRVHLQEFADIAADTDGNTLFNIVLNSKGGYNIRHKDMSDKINNSTTTYLDPAGGNVDGTNLTNVRTAKTSTGTINVGGGIGYWTDEPAARWRFEEVPQNNTYTYNIVDCSGRIAIKYTTGADQPAAKALSSYTDIPAAIRSPYLNGETVKFYTFSGAFDADNLTDENKIAATPVADNANIYVTYTTDRLSEKFLRLRGARAFNFVTNDGYAYDNGGTLAYDNVETNKTQTNHLWNISGGDPYAVQIKNLGTHKYLVSSTMPTLSLAETATNNFILMEQSAAADAGSESVMLMKATGTEDLVVTKAEFQASPVNITTKYYLIDKAGKLIQGNIESESSELGLPDEWRSPLVSEYHYYKTSGYNETTQTYTPADPITSPFEAGADGNIYVTYDVSDAVDLTGGKTYLLKFSGGEYFHQEDGHDGINKEGYTDYGVTSATKAIYPYNNGDFNLYVYGQEQWEAQLASGASTRSRWLWYIISSHDGTPLTGNDIDPYHVVIKSYQNHTVKNKIDKNDVNSGDKNYGPGSSYLQTYKPSDYASVITNIAYENENYSSAYNEKMPTSIVNGQPTEYMILGTSIQNMTLKTFNEVEGERRTVNSFEQYWKNNPTVKTLAGVANPAADNATLTEMGWHQFTSWAYSAPWDNSTKGLAEGTHWYQTISMGSGNFTVEEVSLTPQVILLDQHGWEIMRMPMYTDNDFTVVNTEGLSKYNSPMVSEYQWYPSAAKVTGYHKYNISDPAPEINIYENSANPANNNKVEWHIVGSESFTSNSLAVTPDGNLTGYSGQDKKYKTDFYVTYTVKSEYDNAYTGAATSDAAVPSAYLLKQGGSYASTNGSAITATTAPASMEDIPNVMQWNLRPNFDIDREMGYKYAGEAGAQDGAKNKEATDQDNYDEGRNGFDPYNVQIKSVAYPLRYFTANTTGIALEGGAWKGTSDAVNLQNLSNKQTADGYDQTKLSITNATFMVVDDGTGNMRLMPRFDNSKVVTFSSSTSTPFKTLETQTTAATTGDKGTGTQTLWLELVPKATEVHFSSEMTDMNGHYLLAEDFTFDEGFTSLGTSDQPFRGIIDGQLNTLSGTSSVPLVAYAGGAIIRNVILEKVDISTGTNVGAICCEATGSTRIYNCGILGGSVGGSGDVGGIVGSLDGSARVINCYSYATITGGNNVGGIVGNNKGTTTAININTMVMNCMFYGDITGGTTVSPVFGGNNIANLQGGLNTFNYYAYDKLKTKAISDNKYNSALAVEEKYLNRFEFYRLLLNSNKKLAAFYATGNVANADQMAKWVLETADRTIANPKPYPILKAQGYYPSIINIDAENAPLLILENDKPREEDRKKGGKLGKTLSVTISGVGSNAPTGASITNGSLTLQRTDKDFDRFNFNYDKVQLPYYNDVGTGNYTGNKVVTGWKITAITAVEGDPYTSANYPTTGITDFPNHNYADRKSSNKDLYSVSKRVFSQGAYFDVPYGVTSITIEPYWGQAAYIADANYDVVYKNDYTGKQNVTQTGTQVGSGTKFNEQTVHSGMTNALNALTEGSTVYDKAVVLVGNLHLDGVPSGGDKAFTMMSVDEDNDHEPDYSLIYHHKGRTAICPIRFDFLNIPGTAQAQKPNGASLVCNFTIFKTKGWFEVTNTSSFYTSQLEYENLDNNTKTDAPLILLGGVVDQFVSTQSKTVTGKTIYIHVGGNVWIKEFGMGTHSDGSESTPHVPVSVTGGEFPGFYLTGTYKADAKVRSDDAECYISGGYFHEVAGASLEQIDGNVRWQIYNADIDNFFGGGINDAKPIKGDITTDIYNSHVTLFCGGPKFGNMQAGKKVSTNAEGCTFEKFFGAGYGGTSIAKKKYYDKDGNQDWSTLQGYYINDRGKYFNGTSTGSSQISGKDYGKKGPGVATDFDYEFFVWTSGATGARLYVNFASFSLAQCYDVSSTLKKCTVETNFYGGGNLGKVVGTATSVLEDCTVNGSVYGAGYSASLPTVEVRDGGFVTNPNYNPKSGMFEPAKLSGTTTFTWQNAAAAGKTLTDGQSGSDLENHILYTNTELTGLGEVAKSVLTINGTTTVAESVYGGGEESNVSGDTRVNISGGTIAQNVYGGGKGVADEFACTKAMIGIEGEGANNPDPEATKDKGTIVNISDGTVNGNVYGGGEVGRVEWNTQVTIGEENGTGEPVVEGYVFGAGKGLKTHGYAALVRGNPTVIIQGNAKIKKSVYGGGEIASVARYKVASTAEEAAENGVEIGMPYALANNYSGNCKVIVGGNAVIGPDEPMKMVHPEITDGTDKPDDFGHVFAAGKGVLPEVYTYEDNEHRPKRMLLYNAESLPTYWEYADEAEKNIWEYFEDEEAYFAFVKTLALSSKTEVTIKDNAFVKGSVYGGSENGLVQFDTDVKIQGGQIGCGKDATEPYGDEVWANDDTPSGDLECASWDYGKDTNGDGKKDQYAPYDPYAKYLNPADKKYYYDEGFTKYAEGGANIATDGHTYYGNVFGGGSGSVPYLDTQQGVSRYVSSAGIVKGNTKVTISGGHILTNVYGGCEATNVLGSATIKMTGGTVGVPRTLEQIVAHPVTCYIFGAGKGDQRIFFNKETNVDRTTVSIEGGKVYGSVFGGGEDGHVFQNTTVNIGTKEGEGPTIGTLGTSYVDGNVFGGGRGFSGDALTAGNVGGSVELNIKSGKILGSVYGGGRLASVGYGLYLVDEKIKEDGDSIKPYGILRPDDKYDGSYPDPSTDPASTYYDKGRGYITINISGGTIGNDHEYIYNPTAEQKAKIPNTTFDYQNHLQYTKGGNVFTGGMGRLYALDNTTLLPLWPKLGKCKGTTLNMTGGTVKSSIYGGGEIGAVAQNATVNINGGTVGTKVVDKEDATKYYYFGSVFGGGKGSVDNITYPSTTPEAEQIPISEAGTTGGDVLVKLNEGPALSDDAKGAIVHQVFGCNDMNGSPKGDVTVHVYATQNADKVNISAKPEKGTDTYDVQAVYGGGNLAAYEPTNLGTGKTNVIIDGCGLTSIRQVYGGGNAASTPATNVEVNGTYEILELFGGGNGFDKLPDGRPNPGANVGYKNYTVYKKVNDKWVAKDDPAYDTKEERTAPGSAITYGTGQASVNVFGGTVHRVFGGSNTKGNVRQTAVTLLDENSGCSFCVDEAYGGGKSALMDAEAKLHMACIPGLQAAYGGAEAAAIKGNVTLNITNGTFDRVFGGNNLSGTIDGSITVNIQEVGCRPIKIGELYGGGNQAGYSVYGYNDDDTPKETGTKLYDDPQVNVMSFTSIGKVFGGGFGSGATMVGNPTVNVNEVYGKWYNDNTSVVGEDEETPNHYPIPSHAKGKMGAIHTVFGGGNAAKVMGNTTVNIATQAEVYIVKEVTAGEALPAGCYTRSGAGTTESPFIYTDAKGTAADGTTYYEKQDVLGADIRGDVYGGGNNAEVTGDAKVKIGKKKE